MIWRSSYHTRIAQLADLVTTIFGFILSYYISILLHIIYPKLFPPEIKLDFKHYVVVILTCLFVVLIFREHNAYSYQRFKSLFKEYTIIIKVNFYSFLFIISITFLLNVQNISRTITLVFLFTSLILFIFQKTILFLIAKKIRNKGKYRKRVIILGTGTRARNFISIVKNNFSWGLDIIGILTGDQEKIGQQIDGIQIIDNYKNIQNVLKTLNPEEIIITISTKRFDQIREVLEICETEGVTVRLNSDFFGHITKHITVDNIFGLNIISFNMVKQSELQLFLKRIIDIIGSLIAILLFSPFMIIAAIGIWLTDGRPILYQWNVIGLNKKPFKSWKFRTMVKDADKLKQSLMEKNEMDGPVFKIKDDPRILKFGKWLRKWSIDETPQLFSVLIGNMSLVGPRPAGPQEFEKYASWHKRKLSIKPGITCLWQANGRNKINKFDDWVKLDLEYIDNWSLLLDLKILLKTIPAVILGKGAS